MTSKEMLEVMAAGNATTNNFLFLLVGIALIMLVIVLFNSVRMNAILTNFIMNMSGRSTAANELSGSVGQANTAALSRQAKTLDGHTDALEDIDTNVKTALAVLDVLGLDVDTLAKHAAKPTSETKKEVNKLADKAADKNPIEKDKE